MHKTDKGKISWPRGISSVDRRFCRRVYSTLCRKLLNYNGPFIIACSGGIDSSMLAHAISMTSIIENNKVTKKLVYINHNLRKPEELLYDMNHVSLFADTLGFECICKSVLVKEGNVQAKAREARYNALSQIANECGGCVLLAHNANDVAETKLFQLLTCRVVTGIQKNIIWDGVVFHRPLLNLTRQDIERYMKIWGLDWAEDSTNKTNKYSRNRIRRELIPWIEKNLNPGIVKCLSDQ
jgi:tRNA(Ile)-lysidine synthase